MFDEPYRTFRIVSITLIPIICLFFLGLKGCENESVKLSKTKEIKKYIHRFEFSDGRAHIEEVNQYYQ